MKSSDHFRLGELQLRFLKELWARGLGVAGSGFRSDLGLRVKALLEKSTGWQELPASWRWGPALLLPRQRQKAISYQFYGMADGSGRTEGSDDDLESWEAEHIIGARKAGR